MKITLLAAIALIGTGYTALPERVEYKGVSLNPAQQEEHISRGWNSVTRPTKADIVAKESWLLPDTQLEFVEKEWKTTFTGSWMNYLSADGFKPIDQKFIDAGVHFEMTNAPFEVYLPKRSVGIAVMHNNNRWDTKTKKEITDPPLDMSIQAMEVNDVAGRIERGNITLPTGVDKNVWYVIYPDAYPNADLIYYVHYGSAPELAKLIRFNAVPLKLDYPFKIGVMGVRHNKTFQTSETRSITFKDYRIWDSGDYQEDIITRIRQQKVSSILVDLNQESPDKYLLTKHIPVSFFNGVIFPVYSDLVTTFNPDANPETTSVDGDVRVDNAASWTLARDPAAGSSAQDVDTDFEFTSIQTGGGFYVYRDFVLFDTSALGASAVISAATFDLTRLNNTGGGTNTVAITNSTPASNTALATGDFDALTLNSPTEYITRVTVSLWTADGNRQALTLNADGRANISLTGVSKFAIRNGNFDIDNVQPPDANWVQRWYSAEQTGTTDDPALVVTYTSAAGAVRVEDVMWFD